MANDFVTIADMLADALDLAPFELSEIRDAAPLLSRLPAVPSSNGEVHKYAVNTANPTVAFRAENAGRDFDHSVHRIDSILLKILDFSWAADKAVADRWRQGGASAYVAREGMTHIKAAMFALEMQFVNGTNASADGFPGLRNSAFLNGLTDEMVVNAGNSTANSVSSCYLLRVSPQEVAMVMHNSAIELGDTVVQNFTDGSGKNYPAYYTPGCAWVACQLGAKYSAARIANLGQTANTLTDNLIYQALAKFPSGMRPNLMVTTQHQLEKLRASRTATNPTGQPAPTPSEVAGIPLITSDACLATEAVVA